MHASATPTPHGFSSTPGSVPTRFEIGETDFLLDGRPHRILSGALHYFRVHPDQWADRIHKAKLMGLNTIETYVAWNAHAPSSAQLDFTGGLDLGRFLDLVAAEGMHAIVRPGPYICAEWTNGGLPAWLFTKSGIGVRRSEPVYVAAVADYLQQVAAVVVPRQIDHGGPVVLVQIENEYGAYGSDKEYLATLVDITRGSGITVPMITVDQPTDQMLADGSLPGLHRTGSFGSNISDRLEILRRHQPAGPLMCSEFWNGWFDHWGEHHHRTSAAQAAADLETLLAAGASVNIYMFHGGTNFGLTSGANDKGVYKPIVTSYDYDAPLDESGSPTEKYWAFRDVIARYAPVPAEVPETAQAAPAVTTTITEVTAFFEVADELGEWSEHPAPPSMDDLGQYDGFVLYRTELPRAAEVLTVTEVRDRAQVFVDGAGVGVLARDHRDTTVAIAAGAGAVLDLLVEDQGRVNYGARIGEHKGLIGAVTLDGEELAHWRTRPIDLTRLDRVRSALDAAQPPSGPIAGPLFARATFDVEGPGDLHLDTRGWGKGVAWVNGFCLGRFWSRGPQRTLYVPAPVLGPRDNELLMLELHGLRSLDVRLLSAPDLGHTEA